MGGKLGATPRFGKAERGLSQVSARLVNNEKSPGEAPGRSKGIGRDQAAGL